MDFKVLKAAGLKVLTKSTAAVKKGNQVVTYPCVLSEGILNRGQI
jgi:hypothetical protein